MLTEVIYVDFTYNAYDKNTSEPLVVKVNANVRFSNRYWDGDVDMELTDENDCDCREKLSALTQQMIYDTAIEKAEIKRYS